MYSKQLSSLLSVLKGTLAGLVIKLNGEVLSFVQESKKMSNPDLIKGELIIVIKLAKAILKDLNFDELDELFIGTGKYRILIQIIDNEKALVIFLDASSNLGLARKRLKALTSKLKKEGDDK